MSLDAIWVETKNRGKTPQIIHFNIGFSIIFTIHFVGFPPYSWKHPYDVVVFLGGCVVCEIFLDHVTIYTYIYIYMYMCMMEL